MKKVRRIYHIDDDEDDRFFIELAIKAYDSSIQVTGQKDVEAALKDLSSGFIELPDIIIVDWNMPKLHGGECIAEIKKLPKYNETPIVVFSTSCDPLDRARAEKAGAYYYTKPTSLNEMKERIKDAVLRFSIRLYKMP